MALNQWLPELTRWLWPALVPHLWLTMLFALAAWLAATLLKGAPARWRYGIWLLALTRFLLPSSLIVSALNTLGLDLHWQSVVSVAPAAGVEIFSRVSESWVETLTLASDPRFLSEDGYSQFYVGLTLVWLIGATVLVASWSTRRRRFKRIVRANGEVSSGREMEVLRQTRSWLCIRREIRLVVSPQVAEAGVWGVWRPVIVLPAGIAERLSDDELAAVMLHELIHVLRWDNLFGTFQMLVCCVFWFHPFVWLVDRRLLAERELACDEAVIGYGGEPKLYAASLWKVAQFGFGWPVAGLSRSTGSNLRKRIEHMLSTKQTKISPAYTAFATAVAMILMIVSVALGAFSRDGVQTQGGKPAGGVNGGVAGGVPGGVPGGVAGGVSGRREQNKWELIRQAPEYPVQIETAAETPLLITDARVRVMIDEENQARRGDQAARSVNLYMVQFNLTLVNQTDRKIKGVVLEYQNPGYKGKRFTAGLATPIEPNGSFEFGKTMLHHLVVEKDAPDFPSRFVVKVAAVEFEAGPRWGAVEMMDVSIRPQITYKEKATYTDEARNNRIAGTVVLSVIFAVDGKVTEIQVVRGLPDGLTEKAIEAAQKIRFIPAQKDGKPVSVRGNIEFNFSPF